MALHSLRTDRASLWMVRVQNGARDAGNTEVLHASPRKQLVACHPPQHTSFSGSEMRALTVETLKGQAGKTQGPCVHAGRDAPRALQQAWVRTCSRAHSCEHKERFHAASVPERCTAAPGAAGAVDHVRIRAQYTR